MSCDPTIKAGYSTVSIFNNMESQTLAKHCRNSSFASDDHPIYSSTFQNLRFYIRRWSLILLRNSSWRASSSCNLGCIMQGSEQLLPSSCMCFFRLVTPLVYLIAYHPLNTTSGCYVLLSPVLSKKIHLWVLYLKVHPTPPLPMGNTGREVYKPPKNFVTFKLSQKPQVTNNHSEAQRHWTF